MSETIDTGEDVIEEIAPRTIRFPAVEWNGSTYTEITLQPLTIQVLLEAEKRKAPLEKALLMVQISAGIPPQLAQRLSPKVLDHASEYFARFLPPDPKAGGGASPAA